MKNASFLHDAQKRENYFFYFRNKIIIYLTIILVAITSNSIGAVSNFISLTNPIGITADEYGNVYAQSLSILGDGGLFKINSSGVVVKHNSNFAGGSYHLHYDKDHKIIWAIETQGKLYIINPSTLEYELFLDLRLYVTGTKKVLNVNNDNYTNLIFYKPNFGDIYAHKYNSKLFYLLISGSDISSYGNPFTLRINFEEDILSGLILMATSIPLPNIVVPVGSRPYGIAVDRYHSVVTTMLDNLFNGTTPPRLVTFQTRFPETGKNLPEYISPKSAYSLGMTAPNYSDGVYVATVNNGYYCGAGPAVLFMPPELNGKFSCVADLSSYGLGKIEPNDVAIDEKNRLLYVTMTKSGKIAKINIPKSALLSSPPGSIAVPSTDSDGNFTVKWSKSVTPSVTYTLQEAKNKSFTQGLRVVYKGTGQIANISGRSKGANYYYRIKTSRLNYTDSLWKVANNSCIVK